MAFEDADFIAMTLPTGVTFSRNGTTMSVADAITEALDEAGSREGALALLFKFLEADQFQSETIGRYSYTRWNMLGSAYWAIQAAAASVGSDTPNVIMRPSSLPGGYW
jgi:hypothetical protein